MLGVDYIYKVLASLLIFCYTLQEYQTSDFTDTNTLSKVQL